MRIVFIHGPAAVGKLTIAQALAEAKGLRVFHNHLAVDLSLSMFEFGSSGFKRLRERVWLAAFEEAVRERVSIVFTFCPDSTVSPAFIDRVEALARDNEIRLDFVALTCAEAELERRIELPSRSAFGKIGSRAAYRELRDAGAFDFREMPRPTVTIDTDSSAVEESVATICRAIGI